MPLKLDGIEYDDLTVDPTTPPEGRKWMTQGRMKRKRKGLIATSVDCISAAVDPTATDDIDSGHTVGMKWINTATDDEFVCLDDTATAAVWKKTTADAAADIADFDTEVGNHTDVAANTSDRHTHGNQAALDLVSGTNTGDEPVFAGAGADGLVPDPTTATGKYLKDDGTWAAPGGSGDMLKATYDPTNVNNDAFARANHTGTQTAATISDFDTEVGNHTDVAANTTNRHSHGNTAALDLVSGTNTGDEPDASTTVKGIVELATDGENAANVVVQGNDARLSDDRTADGIRTATTVVAVSSATAPTTGQVLTATSGTAADWQTPAGGGGVFGDGYEYHEDLTEKQNSGATYAEATKFTTASLAAGDYKISWRFSFHSNTNSKLAAYRIQVDDTTTVVELTGVQLGDYLAQSGFVKLTLTAATHDIDIDIRRVDTGAVAYIKDIAIEIFRVA